MAARKDEQKAKSQGGGRNKIQGFVFGINLEGSDEVVTEGIKAFTQAMAKQGMILAPVISSKPILIAAKSEAAATEPESPEEELAELDLEPEPESVDGDEGNGAAKPRKPRRVPRPNFLKELNLTQAKVPLAQFMKQKNPQVMLDKYAVVAVWLKEQFNIEEITIDHIFTAFKHLGWESQLPTDVRKPLINLVHARHWFEKGKVENSFAIVWLGESEVGKMGTAEATK